MDENVVSLMYRSIYDGKGAKEAKNDIKDAGNKAKDMGEKMSAAFTGVKWAVLGQAIKKVTGYIADVTKVSADYIETLNVLQVAFDGNTESIRKFSSELADTLNLDDATIIKAAAHFKVLSKSMGIAAETGEKLSKLMTQMTLDLSSLYNMDFDKAQSALQYAMEGRGTSLKQRTGVSVLETSVQTTLDTIGVDAYVEDMNDAEKAIARVISMEYQLMSSQGDLARTIEAPANQMRIMKEQIAMLARNIGNVLLPIIAKILPYFNAILIVLNAIISALARLVGYKENMFDTFEETNTIDYFDGVGAAIDGVGSSAEKTAKKLQGLRVFDKLNVIRTSSDSGGGAGGGAGGGVGGINPNLLKAFNAMADQYKQKLEGVKTKATEIAEKILTWLGFAKRINKETGKTEWYFKKLTSGTLIGAFGVGGFILLGISKILKLLNKIGLIKFSGIGDLVKIFKNGTIAKNMGTFSKGFTTIAKALGMSSGGLAAAAAAFVAVGAAVVYAYTHIEKFKDKVDSAFSSVFTLGKTIIEKFTEIKETMQPILDEIWYIIKQPFEQAWENIETILGMMYDGVVGYFSAIADVVDGAAKIITDIINLDFGKAFKDLGNMVKNVKEDWDEYWEKIGKRFDEWKEELKIKIDEWVKKIKKKIEELPEKLDELPEKAGEAVGKMINKIKTKIEETKWEKFGNYIINLIGEGMLKKMPEVAMKINLLPVYLLIEIGKLSWNIWNIGYEVMSGIAKGMIDFIKNGGLNGVINDFIKGIKKGLGIASPAKVIIKAKIGDYVLEGITEGMERQLPILEKEAQNIADTLSNGLEKATTDLSVKQNVIPELSNMFMDSQKGQELTNQLSKSSLETSQNKLYGLNQKSSNGVQNATFIIQVGDETIAKKVLKDLNEMAKSNGKPIKIGG